MDVGNPSNFARILDLYKNSHTEICKDITCYSYTDDEISDTLMQTFEKCNYLLDPHGAVGYRALCEGLEDNEIGICLETAHPAKFKETVEKIIGREVEIPEKLKAFMSGRKETIQISKEFSEFKNLLMSF